jgi:hypothetical protein
VDATLVQAARRAPGKNSPGGGDSDADHTVQGGQPHYGYLLRIFLRAYFCSIWRRMDFERVIVLGS